MDISLLDQTLIVQIATCFAAGLLSAVTPCVYPLIPVTISIFTASCEESRAHQFGRSACFALGICIVYTLLGLLAAHAGIFFGAYLGTQWFVTGITLVLTTMLLSQLEIMRVPFFSTLQQLGSRICGQGYIGAFMLGAGSGLIAAPCVGPILATILVIAASHQNPTLGGLLLFIYAAGLSIPFLLLGTFSGLLSRLPKSGHWLHWIKFITAIGILLTISFFHRGVLDAVFTTIGLYRYPLALGGLLAFGILFGRNGINRHQPMITLAGALLSTVMLYHAFLFAPQKLSQQGGIKWQASIEAALETEHADIIFVDTYATWCATCKQLEEQTFTDASVQAALQKISSVKIDFSEHDARSSAFAKQFQIQGIPTLLFLDKTGTEIPGTRVNGFMSPSAFLSHLSLIATQANLYQQQTAKLPQ